MEKKYPITTTEKDKWGEYKVIEQRNGIKVRLMKKPSAAYRKKMDKRKKENEKIMKEENKIAEKEKLIQNRIRETAIKELKKEGKL